MKLEIALAFLQSLSNLASICLIINILCWIASVFIYSVSVVESDTKVVRNIFNNLKKFLPLTVILFLLANIPSVHDIWKIRIELIKLELSSPENITKSVDTVERIGKKLECKYLGCNDDKKEGGG